MKISTVHLHPYDDEQFVNKVQQIFDTYKTEYDVILFKMDKTSGDEIKNIIRVLLGDVRVTETK